MMGLLMMEVYLSAAHNVMLLIMTVTSANKTLSTLTSHIASSGGPEYSFVDIDPVNDKDGGQPGGNIRVAYLYDSSVIQLRNPNPGTNKQAIDIQPDGSLTYNPGLIDPTNSAWEESRKPLVAEWEMVDGKTGGHFVTINVHFSSKYGSTPLEGDARPPVNGGVEYRTSQAEVVAVSYPLTNNLSNRRRTLHPPSSQHPQTPTS